MKRIIIDSIVLIAIVAAILYVYRYYGEEIITHFFGEQQSTMYVESTPIKVSIADEPEERTRGLSGVESLREFEGMLFVFPEEDYYGMWMKDMRFPLDILWINNDMRIVHIEENVKPETYPDSFTSDEPARFVLEVNAFFARNANVVEGDEVSLPPSAIPRDLIHILE